MWIFLDLVVLSSYGVTTFFYLNILKSKNFYYRFFWYLFIDFILVNGYGLFTFISLFIEYLLKNVSNYYLKYLCFYVIICLLLSIIYQDNLFSFTSIFLELVFIYLKRYA